jgi:hypothetical protein
MQNKTAVAELGDGCFKNFNTIQIWLINSLKISE